MLKSNLLRVRFGARVERLLERNDMTASELAVKVRIPVGRIDGILAGRYRRITIKDMERIANALGASLHSLLAPSEFAEAIATLDGSRSAELIADTSRKRRNKNKMFK